MREDKAIYYIFLMFINRFLLPWVIPLLLGRRERKRKKKNPDKILSRILPKRQMIPTFKSKITNS